MAQDTMLYWLAQAAKEARRAAGRKQVHVAASLSRDQSTIYRFELGDAWPRHPDMIVAAYADDLDIDPIELWQEALRLWRESGAGQATVAELAARGDAKAQPGEVLEAELGGARRSRRRARTGSGRTGRATPTKAAGDEHGDA